MVHRISRSSLRIQWVSPRHVEFLQMRTTIMKKNMVEVGVQGVHLIQTHMRIPIFLSPPIFNQFLKNLHLLFLRVIFVDHPLSKKLAIWLCMYIEC